MNRIIISPNQKQQEEINLTKEQEHYLKRVLRLTTSDRFIVLDGQGQSWIAQLTNDKAKIIEPLIEAKELPINLTLIAALPKGNGFDDVVRSGTEIGVSQFQPIISERTLLKPSPQKLERWRKIAQEAAEQSERQIVPLVLEPRLFTDAINNRNQTDTDCYICVARGNAQHLLNYLNKSQAKNIIIATGPEGGFTEAEEQKARENGWLSVSLGNRILRAITAPIVALSLVAATGEM